MIIELFEAFDFKLTDHLKTACSFNKDSMVITIISNKIVIDDSVRILKVPFSDANVISAIAYALTPLTFHNSLLDIEKPNFLTELFDRKPMNRIEMIFTDKALEVFIKYQLIRQRASDGDNNRQNRQM